MRIPELQTYQKRRQNGRLNSLDYFGDLDWEVQCAAQRWLRRFRLQRAKKIPGWQWGILVGVARRLALHPPTSEWGRSMRAKRGGYAVQRMYRTEGRNPTAAATDACKWKRIAAERDRLEAEQQQQGKLPERSRVAYLDIG